MHPLIPRFSGYSRVGTSWFLLLIVMTVGLFLHPAAILADEEEPNPPSASSAEKGSAAQKEPKNPPVSPRRPVVIHNHSEFGESTFDTWTHQYFIPSLPIIFFTWIGACIGSFLNVVIYRLPAGLALSKPKSRCPKCLTLIRFRDNIPVLSWFMLRGKCRFCDATISFRYPCIEFLVGALWGGLFYLEYGCGGLNLPGLHLENSQGIMWMLLRSKYGYWALYFWHAILLTVLLAMAMIHYDKHRIPWKLFTFALVLWLIGSSLWMNLYPVGIELPGAELLESWKWQLGDTYREISLTLKEHLVINLESPVTGLFGGIIGAMVGWALIGLYESPLKSNMVKMGLVLGLFLGWQAVLTTGVFYLIVCRGFLIRRICSIGPLSGLRLFLAATLQILLWRLLAQYVTLSPLLLLLFGLFFCLSVWGVLEFLGPRLGVEFAQPVSEEADHAPAETKPIAEIDVNTN